jgi:predicted enzyme related to lactoylglutathione lyase
MVGEIFSAELTIENADEVRDFYSAVLGWKSAGIDMGGYEDFVMLRDEETPVAGICHARGVNTGIPPQWLINVMVEDLDRSLAECTFRGGEQVTPIREEPGQWRHVVIRDPAGAVMALMEGSAEVPDVAGDGADDSE